MPRRKDLRHLSSIQGLNILEAARFAFCIGRPLNWFVTVHLHQAGVERPRPFVRAFLKHFGDWHRKTTGLPPLYVSVLENPPDVGLHIHMVVHVDPNLKRRFRRVAHDWIMALGADPTSTALKICAVENSSVGSLVTSYLGAIDPRRGIKGLVGYCLKGCAPPFCLRFGLQAIPQGLVNGKRCSVSEALNRSARMRLELCDEERRDFELRCGWWDEQIDPGLARVGVTSNASVKRTRRSTVDTQKRNQRARSPQRPNDPTPLSRAPVSTEVSTNTPIDVDREAPSIGDRAYGAPFVWFRSSVMISKS